MNNDIKTRRKRYSSKSNAVDDKKFEHTSTNISILSAEEKLKELYEIIKKLSEKNLTRLLYCARGLTKNGD